MSTGTPITADWVPPGIDRELVAKIPGWFEPPSGLPEISRVFGAISVQYRDGKPSIWPRNWEMSHMMLARELPGLPRNGRLYVHRQVEPILRDALTEWVSLGIDYPILTFGCFAPRAKKTNPEEISLHSLGIAHDVNYATNPLVAAGAALVTDLPQELVACFTRRGYLWGGSFHRRKDAMHLQYAKGY